MEAWVPALAFGVLGAFFLQKAARRNTRRSWSWGRAGEGAPLSRQGYAVWGAVFLSIGWVLGGAPEPSPLAVTGLLVSFLAMLCVGFRDAAAQRARHEEQESDT